MVECFHAITIDAKRLHFRCEQYCIILASRNKLFSRNPFEFFHIRESLVSRSSGLDPRDSILEIRSSNVSSIEARGSSLEARVSSVNLLLSGTVSQLTLCNSSVKCYTVRYNFKLNVRKPFSELKFWYI